MSWYDEPDWRACDACGVDLYGCLNGDPDEHEYCSECAAEMAADEEMERQETMANQNSKRKSMHAFLAIERAHEQMERARAMGMSAGIVAAYKRLFMDRYETHFGRPLFERPEFPVYYDAQGREHAEF